MSSDSKPTQNPPDSALAGSLEEEAEPKQLPVEAQSKQEATVPEAEPQEAASAKTGYTASTWMNNKKIVAVWSINQNRNSWVAVEGVGWKKLANNSDSAIVALTILGAHALQTGRTANLREENGQIKEIYAW